MKKVHGLALYLGLTVLLFYWRTALVIFDIFIECPVLVCIPSQTL